jgi:polar amino acid transport system substrate-binding protein
MKSRRLTVTAAAGVLVALLAGCTSTGTSLAGGAPPSASVPKPDGVQDPAQIPSAAAEDNSCDPRASLRPPATMPAPGQMPAGSSMAAILKNGRLTVGVDQNTYLFGYRDAVSGQVVGFDIDIARQIAKAIFGDPNKIELTAITAEQRVDFVQQRHVDIVVDTMTINCDRLSKVAFSTVYYDAGQEILVPSSSTAKNLSDLGGKKVCAAAGSTSIVTIANTPSHPVPVSVADWTDCLVMLQQGQVDAVSTDNTILAGMAAQDPNTKLVGPPFTSEPYGVAINRSSSDLVRFVNGVLDQIRANGTWASIYTKWLGGPAPAPPAAKYSS